MSLKCHHCFMESKYLKKCKDCAGVWYCSRECQKQDWKEHKQVCSKLKIGIKKEKDRRKKLMEADPKKKVSKKEKQKIKSSLQNFVSCKTATSLIGAIISDILKVKGDEYVLLRFKTCLPKINEFDKEENENFISELFEAAQYCELEKSDAGILTKNAWLPKPSKMVDVKIYKKSHDNFQFTFKPAQQNVGGLYIMVETKDPIKVIAGFVLK